MGLLHNDLITKYDALKIKTAEQLVQAVQNRFYREQIEMVVVRGNEPMQFFVNGGTIGVRIVTIQVPKGELDY